MPDGSGGGESRRASMVTVMSDLGINLAELARIVTDQAPLARSCNHGVAHWRAVARTGLLIASHDERVDSQLVVLFALLHDSQRFYECDDSEHGPLAQQYLATLLADRVIMLDAERAELLGRAIRLHDAAMTSSCATTAACWDADRLQLQRFSVCLDQQLFSSAFALDPQVRAQVAPWHHLDALSWSDLDEIAHDQMRQRALS